MKNIWATVILLVGVVISVRAVDLATLLAQLSDPSPSTRMTAFYQLKGLGFPGGDQTNLALIQLLGRETAFSQQPGTADDNWASYYGDVIAAVAALKDPRSASQLLDVIQTGSTATSGLASLGLTGLDGVIQKLTSTDPTVTTGAGLTISRMLDPDNFPKICDAASKAKINAALQNALASSSTFTRNIAASSLTKLAQMNIPGDVNGDLKVDCSDIAIVKAAFGTHTGQLGFDARADVNLDGVVDIRDLSFVSQHLPTGTRCQ